MNILIVDDEVNILKTTSIALKTMGHAAFTAQNTRQARKQMDEERMDAMFVDVMLGRENGLDFLEELRAEDSPIPVIVFTAHSSVESAVESMKRGAYDYIQKPFVPDQIRQMLVKLEANNRLRSKIDNMQSQLEQEHPTISLGSQEPSVQKIYDLAFKAAPSEANVLLLGPSGTGKTVVARGIHDRSARCEERFVTVNCPSLSRELLESDLFGHLKGAFTGAVAETWGKVTAAEGGTLFLDEIGEMPLDIQPKLLRLLQDREYERVGESKTRQANIRLIAATNRNLEEEVSKGTFREDLYYRLNVISLKMPSLADRPSDIIAIAENYLTFFGQQLGKPHLHFSEEVKRVFSSYPWPGNLRELRNTIERAVILGAGDSVEIDDLPEAIISAEDAVIRPGRLIPLEELEQEHIRRILEKTSSLEEAADILGIDSATLYRKRKKMGLV